MYFQSDYILRMIQMMGDFFKRLLDILDETMKKEEYERFIRKQCGLSGETADSLSADSLIDMLPDNPRLMLSELFYVRANAFELLPEERDECLYKALRLLLTVGHENLFCEMRQERLLSLYDAIYDSLTARDLAGVFSFLITAENYSKAEDVLFDALDTCAGTDANMLLACGIAAFERVNAENTDGELIRGGLPRAELAETLDELLKKREMNL